MRQLKLLRTLDSTRTSSDLWLAAWILGIASGKPHSDSQLSPKCDQRVIRAGEAGLLKRTIASNATSPRSRKRIERRKIRVAATKSRAPRPSATRRRKMRFPRCRAWSAEASLPSQPRMRTLRQGRSGASRIVALVCRSRCIPPSLLKVAQMARPQRGDRVGGCGWRILVGLSSAGTLVDRLVLRHVVHDWLDGP